MIREPPPPVPPEAEPKLEDRLRINFECRIIASLSLPNFRQKRFPCRERFRGRLRISIMKKRHPSRQNFRIPAKATVRRAWRDRRTGLWLRESPSQTFDHPVAVALGVVMKEWRMRFGFSAYEVARRAKISRQTLADTENVKGWFSVCVAARICDAIGLRFLDAIVRALRLRRRFSGKKRPV